MSLKPRTPSAACAGNLSSPGGPPCSHAILSLTGRRRDPDPLAGVGSEGEASSGDQAQTGHRLAAGAEREPRQGLAGGDRDARVRAWPARPSAACGAPGAARPGRGVGQREDGGAVATPPGATQGPRPARSPRLSLSPSPIFQTMLGTGRESGKTQSQFPRCDASTGQMHVPEISASADRARARWPG